MIITGNKTKGIAQALYNLYPEAEFIKVQDMT